MPSLERMLQDFQSRFKLPITGKLDHEYPSMWYERQAARFKI
jgi:hypothetical protein